MSATMNINLIIREPSGPHPIISLQKTHENCITPFEADLSFEFPAMPTPVDSFMVEAYRHHGLRSDATPIYSESLPGDATQFDMRLNLVNTVQYTLRITSIKAGTDPSYIIIEDIIKNR